MLIALAFGGRKQVDPQPKVLFDECPHLRAVREIIRAGQRKALHILHGLYISKHRHVQLHVYVHTPHTYTTRT